VETDVSPSILNVGTRGRLEYIKSQRNNRYTSVICSPYLESIDGNIGNLHPMSLGKALAEVFPAITNIRRRDRNLIVINFKFSFNANKFIQSNVLPNNWMAYIPNYKIFRSGIVRGVDMALSLEEIHKGIKFMDRPVEIRSISKLKFKDKNNNNELTDSFSIKIDLDPF